MADAGPATFPPVDTYPEPVDHCDVCRWAAECAARRRADDHLSLVAGISARQRRALTERGVATLEALGDLRAADGAEARGDECRGARACPGAGAHPARRVGGRADHRYELLLPDGRGDRPGARPRDRSRRRHRATSSSTSKATRTPSMTASTTSSACSRWTARSTRSGRATRPTSSRSTASGAPSRRSWTSSRSACERRPGPAHLPLRAVRADRAQAPDGSIRDTRGRGRRPPAVRRRWSTSCARSASPCARRWRATRSRRWRRSTGSSARSTSATPARASWPSRSGSQLGEGERPGSDHLDRIERYNRDDVVSNQRLRDWLESLRAELADADRARGPPPRRARRRCPGPSPTSSGTDPGPRRPPRRPGDRADRPVDRTPEQHGRWLLAQLLGWHRTRGQGDVVGVPSPDGPHARAARRRGRSDRAASSRSEPVGELAKGKQVWRYGSRSRSSTSGGSGRAYEPRQKAERPNGKPSEWDLRRGRRRRPGWR